MKDRARTGPSSGLRKSGRSAARYPERKFRRHMLKLAKESLVNAAAWCDKGEWTWALVMTERAQKLLQAVKSL